MEHANKDGKVVSKLFRAYELYNEVHYYKEAGKVQVSKLFRAYELYNFSKMVDVHFM